MDKFWIKFVPKWFDFLNWIVLLGIFHFLAEYTKNWTLKVIYAVSMIGLWMYVQSHLFNIHFEGIPFIKSERTEWLISLIIAAVVPLVVFILLSNIVPQISGNV